MNRKTVRLLYIQICIFCSIILFTVPVHAAYVDPSVMTYAIQAVAGIIIGLSTVFGVYFSRIRRSLNITKKKTAFESDDLEFRDPERETIRKPWVRAESVPDSPGIPEKEAPLFRWAVLLAFSISFMTCFYEPLQIFFTNIDEFHYEFYDIIGWIVLLFVIVFLVLTAVFFIASRISAKLLTFVMYLSASLFFAMYIQGTILIRDLPPTDGTQIDWSQFGRQNTQSLILFCSVFLVNLALLFFLKRKNYAKVSSSASCFISLVLFATLITTCIRNNGLRHSEYSFQITTDDMTLYSSDRNFIILVMDAVDSKTFRNLLETADPEYREIFEDFTYYPDTLAAYPYTRNAIPFILSGEWYENEEPFAQYCRSAVLDSDLFEELGSQDYSMSVYETDIDWNDPEFSKFTNLNNNPYKIIDWKAFLMDELRMSFYMFMPYQLKKYEPYVFYNLTHQQETWNTYSWENTRIRDVLQERDAEVTDKKRFIYLHARGAHVPYEYDKDLNLIPEEEHPTYEGNVQGTVTLLNMFLEKLKSAGVYDSTAIIILADHGFGDTDVPSGRQNPLLLAKGVDEHHPFALSGLPVSYADLMNAYMMLINGEASDHIFPSELSAPRRYLFYEFGDESHIVEYELSNAPAWDTDALIKTGRVYDLK